MVSGANFREGRVEVWYNDSFSTVCDDHWGEEETAVVCRHLGIAGGSETLSIDMFQQGTGDILLDNVMCNGIEDSLWDCSHNGIGAHNCQHHEDVSVRCGIGM